MDQYDESLTRNDVQRIVADHKGDYSKLLTDFGIKARHSNWSNLQITLILEIIHKAFERGDILKTDPIRTNVLGFDYGYRYKGDGRSRKQTDSKTFRLHTRRKLTEVQLKELDVVTFGDEIASIFNMSVEGTNDELQLEIETAVVEDFYGVCECEDSEEIDRIAHFIQPGFSVGHANNGAGTLGAIVRLEQEGPEKLGLLSCWHVLCGPQGQQGDLIYVPAPMDSDPLLIAKGESKVVTPIPVARLHMDGMTRPDRDGDAAIALFDLNFWSYHKGGKVVPLEIETGFQGTATVTIDDLGRTVTKSGRTTGLTHGRIDGVGIYMIDYPGVGLIPIDGFKIVPLDGEKKEISKGGDSGSIWIFADTGEAVGLHFEGEASGHHLDKTLAEEDFQHEHALACHLERVLERLKATLVMSKPKYTDTTDSPYGGGYR